MCIRDRINVQAGAVDVTNPDPDDIQLPEVIRITRRAGAIAVERLAGSTLLTDGDNVLENKPNPGRFAHVAGLTVLCPATAVDAKGLLKSALRGANPVIFCENKFLYRRVKATLPAGEHLTPIGKAHVMAAAVSSSAFSDARTSS